MADTLSTLRSLMASHSPPLDALVVLSEDYHQVLHPCADSININIKVWNMYFRDLLPRLVKAGDDGNCGSAAVCDTLCLQLRNGTKKSKAVKKHKSSRHHTALGSNKAHSQELKQRQLKRDTSSAKTENITFGKSSSQSNLSEVAEQPIV